ncbi:Alpha/Beta hydrolase protein [Podospora didyma]|uniref:Alpha/Beta hydrolase protein n=1 Tax=Podospora didyma TaxID=330526 RepID=A0AAE0NNZ1_9PEZI|nr:Alpha/Beta hydrolase protein [Podospora didyma]
MLPEPTLTFNLPSLHDGLALDCRVYHPQSLLPSPSAPPWQRHAAVFAHPYAPLGGCYDDPIVDIVASTLLRLGLLVVTFNFRGAHGSAGRTSWTAKAERADYMSVVGFVSYYVHFLDPFRAFKLRNLDSPRREKLNGAEPSTPVVPEIRTLPASPTPSCPFSPPADLPVLLMGGYSYGSMITCQLPSVPTILAQFETPTCGSPAAEIRLRAEHLAGIQNTVLGSARIAAIDRHSGRSPRKVLGMRVGGDEGNRVSHDSKRSFSLDRFSLDPEDKIRKGVAELMAKARKGHKKRHVSGAPSEAGNEVAPTPTEDNVHHESVPDCLVPILGRTTHRPAYLLVSPLQGVITNLATMSFPSPFAAPSRRASTWSPTKAGAPVSQPGAAKSNAQVRPPLPDAEEKLVSNPTLAVYGDRDGFVAARKLRDWAARLQGVAGSRFQAHEVSTAGHFWVQPNVASIMKDAVRTFAQDVLHGR